ncbi:MAG: Penicillin-binding protein 2 [Candidatus Kaiserbacteria bacterium GW2011_GWA2_58_9]|uniref:beta-lactamase n=1 Tax=Candidatus Kaiserbacteria bacterium GW2011_GWA2_58_9 TaxID=1618672 RepID=A0A0G1YQ32_9BACT|nr:MAG: Penicillin-binding protein 2 [Candidatus Kaiserbacteria bacterium GW2011_GWA2_58_9]
MEDPFKIQHGGAPISAGEELFDIDASMLRTQKGGGGTLKPPTDQRTTRIAILCIVGVFVVLLARAFSLQFFLTFVPADLPREREERERLFLALSEETGIAATEMDLLIAERGMDLNQPVPLPIPLAYEIALSVYAQEGTWPGVSVVLSSVRQYASTPGMSLAHVLGYTGLMTQDEFAAHKADRYRFTDMIGKQGIEASFEPLLRGTHGTRTVEVGAVRSDGGVPQEIRISVTVSWRTGAFQTRSFTIRQNLYRWVNDGSGA